MVAFAALWVSATPMFAQIGRPFDPPRAREMTECGNSEAPPRRNAGAARWAGSAALGVLGPRRPVTPGGAPGWLLELRVSRRRACYRRPMLRAQAVGAGADAAVRLEGVLPVGWSIPTAPPPELEERARFIRFQLLGGVDVTQANLRPALADAAWRGWAGLGVTSPGLEMGWAGVSRLRGRLVGSATAEVLPVPGGTVGRPRLGVDLPLFVGTGSPVYGATLGTERVFSLVGRRGQTRRRVTVAVRPLPGPADWLTLHLERSSVRLDREPTRATYAIYASVLRAFGSP